MPRVILALGLICSLAHTACAPEETLDMRRRAVGPPSIKVATASCPLSGPNVNAAWSSSLIIPVLVEGICNEDYDGCQGLKTEDTSPEAVGTCAGLSRLRLRGAINRTEAFPDLELRPPQFVAQGDNQIVANLEFCASAFGDALELAVTAVAGGTSAELGASPAFELAQGSLGQSDSPNLSRKCPALRPGVSECGPVSVPLRRTPVMVPVTIEGSGAVQWSCGADAARSCVSQSPRCTASLPAGTQVRFTAEPTNRAQPPTWRSSSAQLLGVDRCASTDCWVQVRGGALPPHGASDASLQVTFPGPQRKLTLDVDPRVMVVEERSGPCDGGVCRAPPRGEYPDASGVVLYASGPPERRLAWTGCDTLRAATGPCTLLMRSDRRVGVSLESIEPPRDDGGCRCSSGARRGAAQGGRGLPVVLGGFALLVARRRRARRSPRERLAGAMLGGLI